MIEQVLIISEKSRLCQSKYGHADNGLPSPSERLSRICPYYRTVGGGGKVGESNLTYPLSVFHLKSKFLNLSIIHPSA